MLDTHNSHTLSFHSPVGWLKIISSQNFLKEILFCEAKEGQNHPDALSYEVQNQLQAYFEGKRTVFEVPLAPVGTDFQKKVWEALLDIPFGKTISYLELSKRIGNAKAVRAVGRANGQNPIPILIPCHRVIGSDGSLVGYGGGIARKKYLLELEGVSLQQELHFQ